MSWRTNCCLMFELQEIRGIGYHSPKMSKDVQRCPKMSKDVQRCPKMSKDVQCPKPVDSSTSKSTAPLSRRTSDSLGLRWLTRYPPSDKGRCGTGGFGTAAQPWEEALFLHVFATFAGDVKTVPSGVSAAKSGIFSIVTFS